MSNTTMKIPLDTIKVRIDNLDVGKRYLNKVMGEAENEEEGIQDVKEVCKNILNTVVARYPGVKGDAAKNVTDFFILEALMTFYGRLFQSWNKRLVNGYNLKLVRYADLISQLAKRYEEVWKTIKHLHLTKDSDADSPNDDTVSISTDSSDTDSVSTDSDSGDEYNGAVDDSDLDEPSLPEDIKDLTAFQALRNIAKMLRDEYEGYENPEHPAIQDRIHTLKHAMTTVDRLAQLSKKKDKEEFSKVMLESGLHFVNLQNCFFCGSSNKAQLREVKRKKDLVDSYCRWACYLLGVSFEQ